MSARVIWLPFIAVVGVVSAGIAMPAWARGGPSGVARSSSVSSPHLSRPLLRSGGTTSRAILRPTGVGFARRIGTNGRVDTSRPIDLARHIDVQTDLRLRHRGQLESGFPVGVWPYGSYPGVIPVEVPVGAAAVTAQNTAPSAASPEALPDFSYVPGCRAMQGGYGYHCEVPRKEAGTP
jgi:hypothetical protein